MACDAMGLEGTFEELTRINEKARSSRIALREFWGRYSDQEEILQAGLEALKSALPPDANIDLVPGAQEVLDALQVNHTLALVTAGYPQLQFQKMEKAGIQPEQFSKIIVSTHSSKKLDYQKVLSELNFDPSEAVVCGDRVEFDLMPAKELGIYTVHFQNGRGNTESKEGVDLTIKTLKELQEVFVKHES